MIAEVINNGELRGVVEPTKQDVPNSDAMKVNNKKRKRGESESEAPENVKEKKPQLKKKKRRRKRKKPKKKVGNDNESGSTGLQLVAKTDESILRKNVETSLNIYVGGIPYYTTEDDIRSYFQGFGTITYIDCMTFPESGKSRGFAIITYKTEAAVKRALALDGFDFGGVFLKIQHYKSTIVNKLPKFSPSVVDVYNMIYIGNLSLDTTEVDLWKFFADCAVTSIRFGEDKEMGEFKGYAHVDFADGLSLHTALKLDQTIVCGRPVRISCLVPKKETGTQLILLPKDNQEDSEKNGNTTQLESTPKDNEVDKCNVSVVENQVTSSGTNDVSPKIRWRTCYKCRTHGHLSSACLKKLAVNSTIPGTPKKRWRICYECRERGHLSSACPKKLAANTTIPGTPKKRWRICYECRERGHLSSACPKKLAANSTILGQMIVSSEKNGSGTTLIPLPKDNQEGIGKKRKFTKFEATPRDHEIDQSTVSLVVENQVTSSGTNALSSKKQKRKCCKCKERGHLLSSCPKNLAADSTNPDDHDDSGKGSSIKFEVKPRDNEVDRSNVSVVENQVTSRESKALSSKIRKRVCYNCRQHGHLSSSCLKILAIGSKIRKRTCYKCREHGHLSSSCPKKLAVDSSNPAVENQVTSNERDALSSRIRKRTCHRCRKRICYKCRERGHLSSSCPKKLAADSTNPVTAVKLLPIHCCGCTLPVDTTSVQESARSTLVRWLRPTYPWIKLNTDGSFDRDTGVASGGGLIRDHLGDLQLAFYMPLEATSSFDAEVQALLHGLDLARQFNRPIWIELDALEVVRLFETGRPGAWQIHRTLIHIRSLMTQIQTWITHIFREGNRPADYMATMGVGSHALHLVYPDSAPKHFMELVLMDQIGYPSFRVR